MASSQISGGTRVQVLLEYLGEKELDAGEVAHLKRNKLQQLIQIHQLQSDANQVKYIYLTCLKLPPHYTHHQT